MNPTGLYVHMFEEDKRIGVIKTTEDEIPQKSKTGNFETKTI
jgi:hypothetical protein